MEAQTRGQVQPPVSFYLQEVLPLQVGGGALLILRSVLPYSLETGLSAEKRRVDTARCPRAHGVLESAGLTSQLVLC